MSVYIGNIEYGGGVMNTTERFKGLNTHRYSGLYAATFARNNLRSVQLWGLYWSGYEHVLRAAYLQVVWPIVIIKDLWILTG